MVKSEIFFVDGAEKSLTDNQKSISILESESNSPTLNVLETFFNIGEEVIKGKFETQSNNHMWDLFCPEAIEASEDPDVLSKKLLETIPKSLV